MQREACESILGVHNGAPQPSHLSDEPVPTGKDYLGSARNISYAERFTTSLPLHISDEIQGCTTRPRVNAKDESASSCLAPAVLRVGCEQSGWLRLACTVQQCRGDTKAVLIHSSSSACSTTWGLCPHAHAGLYVQCFISHHETMFRQCAMQITCGASDKLCHTTSEAHCAIAFPCNNCHICTNA